MPDYTTAPMVVRSLDDDILRTEVPPAGAVSWGVPDGNGGVIDVSLADLSESTPAAPAPTLTAQAILAQIDVPASAAAGVQVSIANNKLVFGVSGTAPTPGGTIQVGGTIGTPGILILSTTAY